jgi:hypothetical protein
MEEIEDPKRLSLKVTKLTGGRTAFQIRYSDLRFSSLSQDPSQ